MSDYTGKRVLVTGGAGAIGSNLVRALLARGALVMVLDNLSAGHLWALEHHERLAMITGNVTNDGDLEAAFRERPEIVVHLAALYGNLNSLLRPETDLHTNGLGVLRTLQYAARAGVQRFLFASSGCSVYGPDAPQPLHEDQPPAMHYDSPYQITKLLGELYCNHFHHRGLVPTVRLRFFSSFGPGEVPGKLRGVVPNFLWRALRKEPLTITGTGSETRSFTFVSDLVEGILAAGVAEGIDGEAVNLAGGQERTINELARIVNEATDNPAGVVYADRRPWDRITTQAVSIQKARDRLGYAPTTTLEDGIEKTVAWFRTHWDRIQEEARW